MRGEHHHPPHRCSLNPGSSPHARGTPFSLSEETGNTRIIPACAGNTLVHVFVGSALRDHPRMRGEHICHAPASVATVGSSPHARGTLERQALEFALLGIIPACAGNTSFDSVACGQDQDHPRMRGEHLVMRYDTTKASGSSPHARGTRVVGIGVGLGLGIIPACAGNTTMTAPAAQEMRDHPRMRGEHTLVSRDDETIPGSSPHARGTPGVAEFEGFGGGIIPACAGNTTKAGPRRNLTRDHPRMRGEHEAQVIVLRRQHGSSPHARGTRNSNVNDGVKPGIIPACAGNTANGGTQRTSPWDHPRMRGEHMPAACMMPARQGSSPHARGTRSMYRASAGSAGIIPACAGNTPTPAT